jgi:hypothetical protein
MYRPSCHRDLGDRVVRQFGSIVTSFLATSQVKMKKRQDFHGLGVQLVGRRELNPRPLSLATTCNQHDIARFDFLKYPQ